MTLRIWKLAAPIYSFVVFLALWTHTSLWNEKPFLLSYLMILMYSGDAYIQILQIWCCNLLICNLLFLVWLTGLYEASHVKVHLPSYHIQECSYGAPAFLSEVLHVHGQQRYRRSFLTAEKYSLGKRINSWEFWIICCKQFLGSYFSPIPFSTPLTYYLQLCNCFINIFFLMSTFHIHFYHRVSILQNKMKRR